MTYVERKKLYRVIERLRKRPLIVYATSTRPGVNAMMAADAVREFIDQIDAIPEKDRAVDVLIHSSGGDGLAAWKLMSILRERFDEVGVLVPYMAFSAATIFSLGANEIVMHPHASLGPIDPQIRARSPNGSEHNFAYEDLGAFLDFLRTDMGLTEQSEISTVVEKLFSTVDPLVVGAARRASGLSTEIGTRLLRMHKNDPDACSRIANGLNKTFFAHGDAVSRSRARELELQIAEANKEVEAAMWSAYVALEELMQLRVPFDPIALLNAATLPGTAPTPVPVELVSAVAESSRVASHHVARLEVVAIPTPAGLQANVTKKEARWQKI